MNKKLIILINNNITFLDFFPKETDVPSFNNIINIEIC